MGLVFNSSSVFACLATVGLTPALTRAEFFTFRLEGSVVASSITRAPWGAVPVGAPITFEYTFDTNTPDSEPGHPDFGEFVGAVVAYEIAAIGAMGAGSGGGITVVNHTIPTPTGGDRYYVDNMLLPGGYDLYLAFQNHDGSVLPLTSDAIPTAFQLLDWQDREFTLYDFIEDRPMAIGWTSLIIVPAPAGGMMLTAIAMTLSMRRRRPRG